MVSTPDSNWGGAAGMGCRGQTKSNRKPDDWMAHNEVENAVESQPAEQCRQSVQLGPVRCQHSRRRQPSQNRSGDNPTLDEEIQHRVVGFEIRRVIELRMKQVLWSRLPPPTDHDGSGDFKMWAGPQTQHCGLDAPAHGLIPEMNPQTSGVLGVRACPRSGHP